MRVIKLRALTVLTSLALLAGGTGVASLASAEAGGPTVTLSSTSATTTNASMIPITVAFSESVQDFVASDVSVTNGTVMDFAGSGASYTFNIDPTADGTVTVSVAADVSTAAAGNHKGNQASNTLTFTSTNLASSDTTAPTITREITGTPTSAFITWTTSEPARGNVQYGLTTNYTSSTTMETAFTTSHSASINGLTPNTTYHYNIFATDAAGNTGSTGDLTFTTPMSTSTPACTEVTISNIGVLVTGTSTATISWTTNATSSSQVFYGTTSSYTASTTLDTTATTTHSVNLSNLTSGTQYHFSVSSGNESCTSASADMTFMTNSSGVSLAVTGVDAIRTTAVANGDFDDGWKWIIHFTVPDNETSMQLKFNDFMSSTTSDVIPAANNIRYYSTQSSNASTTASAIVETNNNYGGAMTLTGDTSSTTLGRQVDVSVEVAVPSGTDSGVYTTAFGALTQ
jgi:large repetitive protein